MQASQPYSKIIWNWKGPVMDTTVVGACTTTTSLTKVQQTELSWNTTAGACTSEEAMRQPVQKYAEVYQALL